MKLLYANDIHLAYPDSWYAATSDPLDKFAPLKGQVRADVCVVGAGYTGLSAALHLAKAGRDVVVLDAQRVGFGASGRNGGQLGSGQRRDQLDLEKMLGPEAARRFWQYGEDAKTLVRDLIAEHDIDCFLRPGIVTAASKPRDVDDLHRWADHMGKQYDYPMETLDQDSLNDICPSPDYKGGVLDTGAGHLHPLRYAFGLARACVAAGVRIFEGSEVHAISNGARTKVQTGSGHVSADHVVLATNGYSQHLARPVAARVMPINNFIAATEPLGEDVCKVLSRDVAVADERFVINYFRLSHDGRLLFGGGESYGYRFPSNIAGTVRKPMLEIFPHLADTRIDFAWGGTLAITMKRLPYFWRDGAILSASGYSGHGVGNATQAGVFIAKAIEGQSDGFDAFAALPSASFPGGPAFKSPVLAMAMSWYALRDRLGF